MSGRLKTSSFRVVLQKI